MAPASTATCTRLANGFASTSEQASGQAVGCSLGTLPECVLLSCPQLAACDCDLGHPGRTDGHPPTGRPRAAPCVLLYVLVRSRSHREPIKRARPCAPEYVPEFPPAAVSTHRAIDPDQTVREELGAFLAKSAEPAASLRPHGCTRSGGRASSNGRSRVRCDCYQGC